MRKYSILFGLALGASLAATGATAQNLKDIDKPLVVLAAGAFDLGSNTRGEGRIEYRFGDPLFWRIKPFVGASATGGGAAYGYAGLLADIEIAPRYVLTPSFAAGAYRQGSGKDLGHGAEFRSQIEVARVMEGGTRLGLGVSHLSNASLGDRNPGANSVFAFVGVPF